MAFVHFGNHCPCYCHHHLFFFCCESYIAVLCFPPIYFLSCMISDSQLQFTPYLLADSHWVASPRIAFLSLKYITVASVFVMSSSSLSLLGIGKISCLISFTLFSHFSPFAKIWFLWLVYWISLLVLRCALALGICFVTLVWVLDLLGWLIGFPVYCTHLLYYHKSLLSVWITVIAAMCLVVWCYLSQIFVMFSAPPSVGLLVALSARKIRENSKFLLVSPAGHMIQCVWK